VIYRLVLTSCSPVNILREPEKKDKSQQLTIFYGGKVLVFDDFPADKAKDLMQLASKSNPMVQISERWLASALCTRNCHRQHEGPQGHACPCEQLACCSGC